MIPSILEAAPIQRSARHTKNKTILPEPVYGLQGKSNEAEGRISQPPKTWTRLNSNSSPPPQIRPNRDVHECQGAAQSKPRHQNHPTRPLHTIHKPQAKFPTQFKKVRGAVGYIRVHTSGLQYHPAVIHDQLALQSPANTQNTQRNAPDAQERPGKHPIQTPKDEMLKNTIHGGNGPDGTTRGWRQATHGKQQSRQPTPIFTTSQLCDDLHRLCLHLRILDVHSDLHVLPKPT